MRRHRFQGVGNIIRFNWPFFMLAFVVCLLLGLALQRADKNLSTILEIILFSILVLTLSSLVVSLYIYDLSGLYRLEWLTSYSPACRKLVNIHSGFDETSAILAHKYPNAELEVLDFYDPLRHTEPSIKRARKVYPSYPGTRVINSTNFKIELEQPDLLTLIFAAHEIRDQQERESFFREINRQLAENGLVIVTEHLRDLPNTLAYNIGVFHFHSRGTWLRTFKSAGFRVEREFKLNPFIRTFILSKNGIAN